MVRWAGRRIDGCGVRDALMSARGGRAQEKMRGAERRGGGGRTKGGAAAAASPPPPNKHTSSQKGRAPRQSPGRARPRSVAPQVAARTIRIDYLTCEGQHSAPPLLCPPKRGARPERAPPPRPHSAAANRNPVAPPSRHAEKKKDGRSVLHIIRLPAPLGFWLRHLLLPSKETRRSQPTLSLPPTPPRPRPPPASSFAPPEKREPKSRL